jgi:putative transposase
MGYRRTRHAVYLCNYHFVWIPKRRKPVLVGKVKERLKQIIEEVCKENDWEILALEIMPDHVHLFLSAPPYFSPHIILRKIKGKSARILRQEFPELLKLPSMWTRSYFVSTAGNVSSETIKKYIEGQL